MSDADRIPNVCFGCTVEPGGDALAIIIAMAGVVISLISAAVSVWTVRTTSKNHDGLILREEFQPHRTSTEASLKVLAEKLAALELSISPGLPWQRIEANFAQEQADTEFAALAILDEARSIDERGLFAEKWEPVLRPLYVRMETSWAKVERATLTENLRRAAAANVVDDVRNYHRSTKTLLEAGVKAPLARKRWR